MNSCIEISETAKRKFSGDFALVEKSLDDVEDENLINQVVNKLKSASKILLLLGSKAPGYAPISPEKNKQTIGREFSLNFQLPKRQVPPTESHEAIMDLYRSGYLWFLVSESTDGILRKIGFPKVKLLELYGNDYLEECDFCGKEIFHEFPVKSDMSSDRKGRCERLYLKERREVSGIIERENPEAKVVNHISGDGRIRSASEQTINIFGSLKNPKKKKKKLMKTDKSGFLSECGFSHHSTEMNSKHDSLGLEAKSMIFLKWGNEKDEATTVGGKRCPECNLEGEIKSKRIEVGEDFPRMHIYILKNKIKHADVVLVLGSHLNGIVGGLAADLAMKKENLIIVGSEKTKYDKYAKLRIYGDHDKILKRIMTKMVYLQGESSMKDWYENIDEYVEEIKEDDDALE